MDMFHTGMLIRALIVLLMFLLLVIAGALVAWRDKRHVSNPDSDEPANPGQRPAVMQRSSRYAANRGRLEANDSEASLSAGQRRAA